MTIVERGVLTDEARAELVAVAKGKGVAGVFALRARIVVWWDEGRSAREIVSLSGMSEPTVRLWLERYRAEGVDGLFGKPHPGKGPVHGGKVRARILALSRQSPPPELGVTHWSSRLLASYLRREGVTVSHVFVADLWRENRLRPWQQGTFKLSSDPGFEEKVTDIVGLYLAPP